MLPFITWGQKSYGFLEPEMAAQRTKRESRASTEPRGNGPLLCARMRPPYAPASLEMWAYFYWVGLYLIDDDDDADDDDDDDDSKGCVFSLLTD